MSATSRKRDGELRARAVIARIEKSSDIVAFMPGSGRRRPLIAGIDILFFPIRPWVIVYRMLDSGDGIYILRIVDGRRDLQSVLRGLR